MGDVRYTSYYERLRAAEDPSSAIRDLTDEGVISALAAASQRQDPYLANVLATEALNRVSRARAVSDSIAEGVYAVDPRGRVTFMNPRAENLLGWKLDQIAGRAIHEIAHAARPDGTTFPAEACPVLRALRTGDVAHVKEDWFRKRDGSFVPVSYTAVPVKREDTVVGAVVTFHDETERRRWDRALHARLRFESTVAHVASILAGATDPDDALHSCLSEIGRVSGAHRAYLFIRREDEPLLDNTHEWCAPGVHPQIEHLQGIPESTVGWWTKRMRRGELVHVEDVDDLPPEAASERELLTSQGIRSILAFPVMMHGTYVGFMGFDDVETAEAWEPEDLRLLSITASNVGSAMERWQTAVELEARAERQAALAQFGQDALRAHDLQNVLEDAVALVRRTLGVECASIADYVQDEDALFVRAAEGWQEDLIGLRVSADDSSQAGHTIRTQTPVVVSDNTSDDRFRVHPQVLKHGLKASVTVLVPGMTSPWGLLTAHSRTPREFTEDEINFLRSLAHAVAAAVERAANERLRRANEARFERIITDVPAALVIFSPQGSVEFSNPMAKRILGDELLSANVTDWAFTYPDGRPVKHEDRAFTRVIEREEAVRGVEGWLERPNGKLVFLHANLVPLRDTQRRITGVLAAFTDATELQQQREDLLELRRLQEEIVENVPAGVMYLDPDGRITYENRYMLRAVGAPEGENKAHGERIYDLPTMRGHDAFLEKVRNLLKHGTPFHEHEEEYRSIYGREATLGVSGVPLFEDDAGDRAGRVPKGGILLVRDVTESRRTEEHVRRLNAELERRVADRTRALEAANEELEAFSFSVSHDIRAPLRGIEYFTRVLEEDYASRLDRTGHEYLARLRSESSRLTTLVNDLLEFSRAGREEVTRERVDVTAVAEDVIRKLKENDPDRDVDARVAPDLHANADPRLLRVVLDNLLSNAWKFTARESTARIEVGETLVENGERAFFVKDNGAGFDPAKARQLFVPFKRLHAQTEFTGTGVGLATVERIVHRHGGDAWAEGAPGEGATFYFTMPGSV